MLDQKGSTTMLSPSLTLHDNPAQWYVYQPGRERYIGMVERVGERFRPIVCIWTDRRWLRPVDSLEAAEAVVLSVMVPKSD
jgi:hypothetical protein